MIRKKEQIMKKALSLILALVLCLSLCACGGGENTTISSGDNASDINGTNNSSNSDTQEAEHVMTDEEIFAAKILIEGVKCLDKPLSTKVKNVWVYTMSIGYCSFTYELEITNSLGNTETVYYGNSTYFKDLSDATLSSAIDDIHTCNTLTALGSASKSMYFRENEIEAMQDGNALNASSIQTYFLKNYE